MQHKRVALGPNTVVQTREPTDTKQSHPLPTGMWHIRTDIGGFGGNVPPGVDPNVRSYATLELAQPHAGFHLATPNFLPDGYTLREVLVPPVGPTTTVLIFGGQGHDIVLAETPVGHQQGQQSSSGTHVSSTSVSVGTSGTLEQTDLDGRPAAWMDGRGLIWEADGVSYHLGGLELTLEEAKAIAISLK